MRRILLFFLSLFFSWQLMYAQEYKYARYDVNNGLAGSTVYSLLQDQQGFMWFGTETGVSRFDGTHFKNFGTADGLPDNEILQMFEDSKGRIWMAPFKTTVAYYFKGKIYNSDNDSILKKIKPNSQFGLFAEDDKGDILMMAENQLFLVSGEKMTQYDSIDGAPMNTLMGISRNDGRGFLVISGNGLYELRDHQFHLNRILDIPGGYIVHQYAILSPHFAVVRSSHDKSTVQNLANNSKIYVPFSRTQLTMQMLGDSLLFLNHQLGCAVYSLRDGRMVRQFMPNSRVSKTYVDNEGNYWFATLGEGVYRLASENMLSVELKSERDQKMGAFVVKTAPGKWLVGTNSMSIYEIKYDSMSSIRQQMIWNEWGVNTKARVLALEVLDNGDYIMGTDEMIQRISRGGNDPPKIMTTIKSLYKKSDNEIIVATRSSVFLLKLPEFKVTDTFWKRRSTSVYFRHDTVFVGTLNGLVMVMKDKSVFFPGDMTPLLRNRVNAIQGSQDGLLWIATSGAGLLGLKGTKIERKITIEDGLSSNNCRALALKDGEIWVGTDKGLNRVILGSNDYKIIKFTTNDGLSSNMINSVGLDGKMVVVATPEGINYFDANRTSFESQCTLVMDHIIVSDKHLDTSRQSLSLPHEDNNIRFEFAGISFRSGGEITYEYRLLGLDTTWRTTTENALSYPTLPSGDYQLELLAVNKFGVRSQMINIPFTVDQLLTEKTWFRVLIFFLAMLAITAVVVWLLRRVKRREIEKSDIRNRMAELEQMALKSQMNPHFIFNCLNSIQQFVLDKDVAGSNRFIAGFSRLIRQTLDISARKEISLTEEILYLSTYLELERTRFENKFSFEIRTGNEIDSEQFYLPPMMLQPFVENSIRHGLRYRPDNLGKVLISFDILEDDLVCLVEDNGIGRTAALRHKSINPIEYQSKGMSLIASRVEFLNKHSSRPITIKIEDMEDNNNISQGTRVVMKFPLENGLNNTNHA